MIIFKKFSKNVFLAIPLTKTIKDTKFYARFEFKDVTSSAILSKVRLFDLKRLAYAIGRMSQGDYDVVKQKLIALLQ